MIHPTSLHRVDASQVQSKRDLLAFEEPLEIRLLQGQEEFPLLVTMRTPGHDRELSLGFLFCEGIITSMDDVLNAGPCATAENVFKVQLRDDLQLDLDQSERYGVSYSSCGVCGKTSLEKLKIVAPTQKLRGVCQSSTKRETILKMSSAMRNEQQAFTLTGGIHACGIFDLQGELLSVYEDIGRHNALDKVLGQEFFRRQTPLRERMIFLSGRASFELLQKVAVAEVPIVVAAGAPSNLAVKVAEEFGITLIGFLRNDSFNIYSHPQRVDGVLQ